MILARRSVDEDFLLEQLFSDLRWNITQTTRSISGELAEARIVATMYYLFEKEMNVLFLAGFLGQIPPHEAKSNNNSPIPGSAKNGGKA
jgi:hypothetical protein